MLEYAAYVLAFCAIVGALSLLSYKGERAERIALGMISLSVIISPLVKWASEVNADDLSFITETPPTPEAGEELSSVMESAFSEGIALAVCERFSLSSDDISVRVFGFDYEKMNAESIRITLSGRAVFAPPTEIESYINKMNVGECHVEIRVG